MPTESAVQGVAVLPDMNGRRDLMSSCGWIELVRRASVSVTMDTSGGGAYSENQLSH